MTFKKKNKPVTKKIWKVLNFLPRPLRKKVIRNQFEVNYNLSQDYVFKHAETAEEIQEALHIVYENYTHLGYIEHREEELHFNSYLCLPTTTILIVKYKGEIIGTMSIVPDSPFGLPTEATWDLSKIRSKYKYIAEISSLSIKRSHKSTKGHILLTLCKFMWEYCVKILNIECIVMAGTQEVEAFYTDLLCFEKVTSKTGQEHKLVRGNKSTCCYLDILTSEAVFEKEYKGYHPKVNFHNFIMHYQSPVIFLPEEHYSLNGLHLKKNAAMIQILEKFPNLKNIFSNAEKMKLSNMDPLSKIESVIAMEKKSTRVYPRISLRCTEAFLFHTETSSLSEIKLIDVSQLGYGLKKNCTHKFGLNDQFILIFQFEGETMAIHSKLKWDKPYDAGFYVLEDSKEDWKRFVSHSFEEIDLPVETIIHPDIKKSA